MALPVASLQHVQNVRCTPKKGYFGLILCSLKQFFSKNTLAPNDFLFLHPRKFYPNDAIGLSDNQNGTYLFALTNVLLNRYRLGGDGA
jgi:hypothetical protein